MSKNKYKQTSQLQKHKTIENKIQRPKRKFSLKSNPAIALERILKGGKSNWECYSEAGCSVYGGLCGYLQKKLILT
jgi:hypothetical protein